MLAVTEGLFYHCLEELDYQRSRLTSDVIKAVTGADVLNYTEKNKI